MPIKSQSIIDVQKAFVLGGSRILTPDMISADFLMNVMPNIEGKLHKSVSLLYQHSAVEQPSAQAFHQACDNQGPTLTFVLANGGYVFGGYNPVSWLSDFMYTESVESYLFQVHNPLSKLTSEQLEAHSVAQSIRLSKNPERTTLPTGPVRCPIRVQKREKAIKQNDSKYSPAFGEANVSDLFIAYKNLPSSYSMIGNVYKLPTGVSYADSETWLAGKKDEWDVKEVEVWSVGR